MIVIGGTIGRTKRQFRNRLKEQQKAVLFSRKLLPPIRITTKDVIVFRPGILIAPTPN